MYKNMKKQTIVLSEIQLKKIIKESISQYLKEANITNIAQQYYDTEFVNILEIVEDEQLIEWLDEHRLPNYQVKVLIKYYYEEDDYGDYWTAPCAGSCGIDDCVIDPDKEFAKYLPANLYNTLIEDIRTWVYDISGWAEEYQEQRRNYEPDSDF